MVRYYIFPINIKCLRRKHILSNGWCLPHISWAKFFVFLRELPNPHLVGLRIYFGSAHDTSPHPPLGSTSSSPYPHPAPMLLDTSAAPPQNLILGSHHVQGPSFSPSLPLFHKVAMTHFLWVTQPLFLMPKKTSELHPVVLFLSQDEWSRIQGGKSTVSSGTASSVTGCKGTREPECWLYYIISVHHAINEKKNC